MQVIVRTIFIMNNQNGIGIQASKWCHVSFKESQIIDTLSSSLFELTTKKISPIDEPVAI